MLRAIATIAVIAGLTTGTANSSPPPPGWEQTPAKSMTYKDLRTSITLYVESDGRHVAAIDADGKLLWVSDLFKKSRPCSAERTTPVIVRIKEGAQMTVFGDELQRFGFGTGDRIIEVTFASNEFGELDERNGDFVCEGIN